VNDLVTIHLCSGTAIMWDGRLVKHCTSLDGKGAGEGNSVHGFFVAAGGSA
jgi:hypothetical protein